MGRPVVGLVVPVMDLSPVDVVALRRLRRAVGDDPRDTEIRSLRVAVDELVDELAALRLALDGRKVEILDLAEGDYGWREIAEAAWPEETS